MNAYIHPSIHEELQAHTHVHYSDTAVDPTPPQSFLQFYILGDWITNPGLSGLVTDGRNTWRSYSTFHCHTHKHRHKMDI